MPYKLREHYLQYKIRRREQALARGECGKCCRNPVRIVDGKELTTCKECTHKSTKWYNSRNK